MMQPTEPNEAVLAIVREIVAQQRILIEAYSRLLDSLAYPAYIITEEKQ